VSFTWAVRESCMLTWNGMVTPYTVEARLPNGIRALGSGGSLNIAKMIGKNSSMEVAIVESE
jgi:hypothetical protein